MGANVEPKNGQFSKKNFHGIKTTFVAAIYFFQVPFSGQWLLFFCRFTKAMTYPYIK